MNNKNIRSKSTVQFIVYALIGASNMIIEFTILNILSYATGITRGKMLFVFNIIAFCVYSICGYLLNKKYTFRETSFNNAYFQYASVLFFSMIINSFLLILFTSHNPLIQPLHHHINIVKLNHLWFNICILMDSMTIGFLGFLINKFFIFNRKKTC